MEARARAELTQSEYEHEVLAEFGTEEMGVFNKEDIDRSMRQLWYTYEPLNRLQERSIEGQQKPLSFIFSKENHAPQSLLRTVGVKISAPL